MTARCHGCQVPLPGVPTGWAYCSEPCRDNYLAGLRQAAAERARRRHAMRRHPASAKNGAS